MGSKRAGAEKKKPKLSLGHEDFETTREFDAWSAFVMQKIDDRCGFVVDLKDRGDRDVQTDLIEGGTEGERETLEKALLALWDEWRK